MATSTYLYQYALNQDCSCVSLSTTSDFRTITLSPSLAEISRRRVNIASDQTIDNNDPSSLLSESPSPVNVASMLFQTNYLALVLRDNPYKVLLWDDSLSQSPHALWSRFEVLNVVLRRDLVCLVSEYKIYVYEFGGNFQVLLHLETCANPKGLCCVSTGDPHKWTLVCPGQTKGHVRIQHGLDDSISHTVPAHSASVAALAINVEGTLIASASEQGTVIKVVSAQDGQLLYEFRRGTTAVGISCISFRADSKFLVLGSASLTVHVFKLDEGRSGTGGGMEDPVTPGLIPKYFQSSRAFAQFKIPDTGSDLRVAGSPIVGPLCCFAKHRPGNTVLVVHVNGLLYEAHFDENRSEYGQECVFTTASAFFQTRPDFVIGQSVAQSLGSPVKDEGGDWHVL